MVLTHKAIHALLAILFLLICKHPTTDPFPSTSQSDSLIIHVVTQCLVLFFPITSCVIWCHRLSLWSQQDNHKVAKNDRWSEGQCLRNTYKCVCRCLWIFHRFPTEIMVCKCMSSYNTLPKNVLTVKYAYCHHHILGNMFLSSDIWPPCHFDIHLWCHTIGLKERFTLRW